MDHVLAHIECMAASDIKSYGYEVHRLTMPPDDVPLPFLLMDTWTLHNYAKATVKETILPLEASKTSIADMYIELVPVTSGDWLEQCIAGQEYDVGVVSFRLAITYTLFPANYKTDPTLVAKLAPNFPRLAIDMKQRIDSAIGVAPQQREAMKRAAERRAKEAMASAPRSAKKMDINADGDADAVVEEAQQPMDQGDDDIDE